MKFINRRSQEIHSLCFVKPSQLMLLQERHLIALYSKNYTEHKLCIAKMQSSLLKQELHIAKLCYKGLKCAVAWSYLLKSSLNLLQNSLKETEIN